MLKQINFKESITIPNFLTILRIFLNIPFVHYFLNNNYTNAVIVLLISAFSDMLDGVIARNFDQKSELGSMLDPIADKISFITVVVCIAIIFPEVKAIVAIMFAKEILMLIGGIYMISKNIKPSPAKWYGKLSTVIFYLSSGIIVLLKAVWNISNIAIIYVLMIIPMVFMLFALFKYAIIFIEKMSLSKQNMQNDNT